MERTHVQESDLQTSSSELFGSRQGLRQEEGKRKLARREFQTMKDFLKHKVGAAKTCKSCNENPHRAKTLSGTTRTEKPPKNNPRKTSMKKV